MIEETTMAALRSDVKLERERYQPKGGMCCTCTKRLDRCNALPFDDMPVIGTTAEGQAIVRCTEHVRSNAAANPRRDEA